MQAKLSIAFVSDAVFPFNKGGKEMRIYNLTTQLAAQGHEVHIYTMKWWKGTSTTSYEGITFHAISRYYPLYSGERRSIIEGVMFAISCLNLLWYRYDILDVDHMPFLQLYPLKLVSLIKRRPMFATWHEVWGTQYWLSYLGSLGYLAAGIERLSVHLPNKIIAVSDQTKCQLQDTLGYHKHIEVIPNGVNMDAIYAASPAKRITDIIFVGRLLENKNVDLLIRALAINVKTKPKISCLIVGDGPERIKLEALVKELNLEKNITFTGAVESNDSVYAYMKSSKIFVLPSIREGFGVVVLEALAAGLKVVTVNHPENAARLLITNDNGVVVEVSEQAIAEAITTQMSSNKIAGHAPVSREYDWTSLASSLSREYSK